MKDKEKLLNTIRKYDFALYELNLYLDTHPKCNDALVYFKKYKELRDKAWNEFTQKYGSLTADQAASGSEWNWTAEPWPWEEGAQ